MLTVYLYVSKKNPELIEKLSFNTYCKACCNDVKTRKIYNICISKQYFSYYFCSKGEKLVPN